MSVATNPDDEQVHLPGAANRKVMRETHTAYAPEFSPYLERGFVNNLRSGSGKSRQREIAVVLHGREWLDTKTHRYRGEFEGSMLPYSATDAQARADADRALRSPNPVRG